MVKKMSLETRESIRVCTFNVEMKKDQARDEGFLKRLSHYLAQAKCDLVALQEVENGCDLNHLCVAFT